jgi:hypothetical protein
MHTHKHTNGSKHIHVEQMERAETDAQEDTCTYIV